MNIYVSRKSDSTKVSPREVFDAYVEANPKVKDRPLLAMNVIVTMGNTVLALSEGDTYTPTDPTEESVVKFITANYAVTVEDDAI